MYKMESKYFIGKKLYRIQNKSYEGDIREEGVNGKLSYAGTVKEIKNGWITFNDNESKIWINNLKKGYLFLDLEDILSKDD